MPERTVICNTSPLLYLHQVSRLELLHELYGDVKTTPAVKDELRVGHERGVDVPELSDIDWLSVEAPRSADILPAIVDLGPGEAEVLALGLQFADSLLILDDRLARRIAKLNRLSVTGTLGVLIRAKEKGFLTEIRPTIDRLLTTSLRMSPALLRTVLDEANEPWDDFKEDSDRLRPPENV
jgi:predicted nucleic acid-binding protein